jgi:Tfp pilus assembly protein PilE
LIAVKSARVQQSAALKLAAQKQETYFQAQMGTLTGTVSLFPTETNQKTSSLNP